jgi:hypothetical protein
VIPRSNDEFEAELFAEFAITKPADVVGAEPLRIPIVATLNAVLVGLVAICSGVAETSP